MDEEAPGASRPITVGVRGMASGTPPSSDDDSPSPEDSTRLGTSDCDGDVSKFCFAACDSTTLVRAVAMDDEVAGARRGFGELMSARGTRRREVFAVGVSLEPGLVSSPIVASAPVVVVAC